ncbi:MAG: hypothetical protein V3W18_07940 [candidate division Zixibacteria bacterium]
MRKFFPTAVLAVFFSLYLSGCYTQFGKPEPVTGEKQSYNDYENDDYDYSGYLSPGFFGYPYYTLGFFYSPWWYDQFYYYTDEENRSDSKFIRYRDHGNPLPPPSSGGILPPSNSPSTGEVKIRSGSDSQNSADESESEKKEKSKGKSTRRRR